MGRRTKVEFYCLYALIAAIFLGGEIAAINDADTVDDNDKDILYFVAGVAGVIWPFSLLAILGYIVVMKILKWKK